MLVVIWQQNDSFEIKIDDQCNSPVSQLSPFP